MRRRAEAAPAAQGPRGLYHCGLQWVSPPVPAGDLARGRGALLPGCMQRIAQFTKYSKGAPLRVPRALLRRRHVRSACAPSCAPSPTSPRRHARQRPPHRAVLIGARPYGRSCPRSCAFVLARAAAHAPTSPTSPTSPPLMSPCCPHARPRTQARPWC
jgi:hypothetical protein